MFMKYAKQVEAALADAAHFTLDGINIVPEFLPDPTILSIPPEADDNYPVIFPSREQLVPPPNSLYVDSPRQVKKIVATYGRQTRTSCDPRSYDLVRQQEHMEAVQRLGGSAVYGVNFFRMNRVGGDGTPHRTLNVIPYDWETTKLGYAIQKMYPQRPTPEDVQDIRQLGYANRNHVVGLAKEHGLPMPLLTPVRRSTAANIMNALQRKGLWRQ